MLRTYLSHLIKIGKDVRVVGWRYVVMGERTSHVLEDGLLMLDVEDVEHVGQKQMIKAWKKNCQIIHTEPIITKLHKLKCNIFTRFIF